MSLYELNCGKPEEVQHSEMHYAFEHSKFKVTSMWKSEMLYDQDRYGFEGGEVHYAESILQVQSKIPRFCDHQITFMWLLKARWRTVMNFNQLDSFNMVKNITQSNWT